MVDTLVQRLVGTHEPGPRYDHREQQDNRKTG
jgi:hypothetical protein